MRAKIKKAFSITGRGTVVVIDLLEGSIRSGAKISCRTTNGRQKELVVEGVEFVDYCSENKSDIGIIIKGINADEVQVDSEINDSQSQ